MENVANAVESNEIAPEVQVKEKRQFVQVTTKDFIALLKECKKENLSQSKMRALYKSRFGGAEQTAIQKYGDLIKQYRTAIEEYKKKEQTNEVIDTITRLNKSIALIELPDGRRSRNVSENETEESKLSRLLSLVEGEELDEATGDVDQE